MFAVAQLQMMFLMSSISDLTFQDMSINMAKMSLANSMGQLIGLSTNLDQDSPFVKALQSRLAIIQMLDKSLDLQKQRIETILKAQETEKESLKKIIADGAKMFHVGAQA